MATVRALAADGEVVQSTELIVSSALATWVTAFLPPVGDGTASTVVDNSQVAFYANALGGIYVKDQYGHLIGMVNPGDSALFTANVVTQGAAGVASASKWTQQQNNRVISVAAAREEIVIGAGAALAFTANSNAAIATPGSVNRYVKLIASDGLPVYIPAWR